MGHRADGGGGKKGVLAVIEVRLVLLQGRASPHWGGSKACKLIDNILKSNKVYFRPISNK